MRQAKRNIIQITYHYDQNRALQNMVVEEF